MRKRFSSGMLIALGLLALSNQAFSQAVDGRIQSLYEDARSAEKQHRIDDAIRDYQAMIRLKPKLAAAYNNLGRLYWQQGRLTEAISTLKHASELNPQLEAPHALMGFSFYEMRNFTAAQQELVTALKLKPGDQSVRLFLARSLTETRHFKQALKLLDQLQQEDPKNPEILFSLGNVYASLAESTLVAIQKVKPNSYLIEVLLGRYDEAREFYSDAAEHYKKAIEQAPSPNVPDLYYDYAHALSLSGHFPEALAAYQRVLKLNPYDYRASGEASFILLPSSPKEAFRLADEALKSKPDLPEALEVRGSALLALGDPQKAVEDLKKAAALMPENAQAYFELAKAYRQLGMTQEARVQLGIYERLQQESHSPKEKQGLATH